MTTSSSGVRMAEAVCAVSLAVDLGMGQPFEQGLRTCLLATSLARSAGLPEDERRRVYYLALLRHVGCTAESDTAARFLGDELHFRSGAMALDWSRPAAMLPYMLSHVGAGDPALRRLWRVGHMLARNGEFMGSAIAVCDAADTLAGRIGVDEQTRAALWHVFERWDGKGIPGLVAGEEVAVPARFVSVAEVAEVVGRLEGREAAVATVRVRRGTAFAPEVVDALVDGDALAALDEHSVWDATIDAEPGAHPVLSDDALDDVLCAVADFADLKSRFTAGRSRAVSDEAEAAAGAAGLPAEEIVAVRRAGLVQDLGRVGVSAGVWGKPGPLTRDEWEQVRLHPYYTERALSRPPPLAALGRLASQHHERCDGSGYHRGVGRQGLSPAVNVLAAADVHRALLERRPHRPAYGEDEAVGLLRDEARAGRLDAAAVDAVLEVARGRPAGRRPALVAGLTAREAEVLRLAARGLTIKEMAAALVVAPKTVDAHLQHIYPKIGVRTRAAATLFALQHGFVDAVEDREVTR